MCIRDSKTLVELGAALVLLASRTGAIAGLDLLRARSAPVARPQPNVSG